MIETLDKNTEQYIIGHLSWPARVRFSAGILISLALFASLGMNVLKPWDPFGAISLLLVDNKLALGVRLIGILIAVSILGTIIIAARLPFFGLFAATLGVVWPISRTAGMDYLMVRLQVGKEFENSQILWAYLAFETVLWAIVLVILIAVVLFIEDWLHRTPISANSQTQGKQEKNNVNQINKLTLKAIFAKENIFNGIISIISTAIFGVIFIAIFAASQSKGQIIFAVFAGMFLASLISEQITPTNHPVWQTLSVIIVALIAYSYTWFNPDRPAGLEAVLHIAPNNLARVLPIEYIFIGSSGAVMGVWYSYRLRHSKDYG